MSSRITRISTRSGSASAGQLVTVTARTTSSRSTPVISAVLSIALIRSVYHGEKPGRIATPEAGARSS